MFSYKINRLLGEVIHDGQYLNAPAICQRITDEIH
jgi:hypothetical protein